MKIDAAMYKSSQNVILSEAKNLGSEMFRFDQHDNGIYHVSSRHAS